MEKPPHPVDVFVTLLAEEQDLFFASYQFNHLKGAAGVARRRVKGHQWIEWAPRVYSHRGVPQSPRGDLRISLLDAGPFAMGSHQTAGAVLHVDGFVLEKPSILVPHGKHHINALATVHQSRLMPQPYFVGNMPITPPLRTLLDLASVVAGPVRLGRIIDELVVRRLVTLEEVAEGLVWMQRHRRPGCEVLRRALDGRTHGYVPSRSELENVLDAIAATIPGLVLEREVDIPRRTLEPHRVDRMCREPKLIVEGDGRLWHQRMAQAEKDRKRDRAALQLGYPTARYGWHELTREAADVRAELMVLTGRAKAAA